MLRPTSPGWLGDIGQCEKERCPPTQALVLADVLQVTPRDPRLPSLSARLQDGCSTPDNRIPRELGFHRGLLSPPSPQ